MIDDSINGANAVEDLVDAVNAGAEAGRVQGQVEALHVEAGRTTAL